MNDEIIYYIRIMAKEKIYDICGWEAVEDLTRRGRMADRVIEEIMKRMWDPRSGLKQNVFLAFGGASIVFDSPLPGVLRMNTYCRDEDADTGFSGESHALPVASADQLEDVVWQLLASAFDDLCDIDEFCSEQDVVNAMQKGRLEELVLPVFSLYPTDSVFLEVWFGEEVSARWLGENVLFIASDNYHDALCCECRTDDEPAELAHAVAEVIEDVYLNYKKKPSKPAPATKYLS